MIRISNLNKIYKNKKRKVTALKDINLSFEETGISFIVGESGAGKTTLLNMLSLQDRSTSGSLFIDNKDVSKLSSKDLATLRSRYFGIVFQELNLIEDFTVYQNIVIGLEIQKIKSSKEEVIRILDYLNMPSELLEEKVYNLSGGQKQRVAIARALIKNPRALICDEPTGSLDDLNAIEIMEILKKIATEKLVIIVSHNMNLANIFGDRVITLKNGFIVSDSKEIDQVEDEEVLLDLKYKRIPFKLILKLALLSIKKSLPRFIFTLISFILTLSIIMASMSAYSFDARKVTEEALVKENVSYFNLKKYKEIEDNILITDNETSFFSVGDLDRLAEYFGDDFILSHTSKDAANSAHLNHTLDSINMLKDRTRDTAYITEDNLKNCGFGIVGCLPSETEGIHEITLTKYECYFLGWIERNEFDNEQKFQDIIDNMKYKINFNRGTSISEVIEFKISGIIDTNYRFLNENEKFFQNMKDGMEFSEMNNTLFFSKEIFNDIMQSSIDLGHEKEIAYHDIYVSIANAQFRKVPQLIEEYTKENVFVRDNCRVNHIIIGCLDLGKIYGTIGVILGLILLVISLFSFVGFIKSSLEINKRTMKILQSLGITKLNCNLVFIIQSTLISLICTLLAIIPYLIVIILVNRYFQGEYGIHVSPLNLSFVVILLTLFGLFILSTLITFLYSSASFKEKNLNVKEEM